MDFYSINGQNEQQREEMTNLLNNQEGVTYQQFNSALDLYVADVVNTAASALGMNPIEEITNRALDTFGGIDDSFSATVGSFFQEAANRINQE